MTCVIFLYYTQAFSKKQDLFPYFFLTFLHNANACITLPCLIKYKKTSALNNQIKKGFSMLQPKNFQTWGNLSQIIHNNNLSRPLYFHYKEGGVYNAYLGANIGYEEDGKNSLYTRPILIVKGYSQDIFYAVPLTTKHKVTQYHYRILSPIDEDKESYAILNQGRTMDIARIRDRNPIAIIDKDELALIKSVIRKFFE